jgi:hypothetical protein
VRALAAYPFSRLRGVAVKMRREFAAAAGVVLAVACGSGASERPTSGGAGGGGAGAQGGNGGAAAGGAVGRDPDAASGGSESNDAALSPDAIAASRRDPRAGSAKHSMACGEVGDVDRNECGRPCVCVARWLPENRWECEVPMTGSQCARAGVQCDYFVNVHHMWGVCVCEAGERGENGWRCTQDAPSLCPPAMPEMGASCDGVSAGFLCTYFIDARPALEYYCTVDAATGARRWERR